MKSILVLGAGRSSGYLIDYLSSWTLKNNFALHIADLHWSDAVSQLRDAAHITLHTADLSDGDRIRELISGKWLTISMLPAFMHPQVATFCVAEGSHMATASYESEEMRQLRPEIERKGLIFLNECGLDPGIDHMSALQIIHRLQNEGYQISEFHSYCGGLVAEESCGDNPWKYKFSWNPRNVIVAGQSTARYLDSGKLRFVPYPRLFGQAITATVDGVHYDGYPNRDSLSYREVYGLDGIQTLVRGTLRHEGYCKAWDLLVQLGLTDDSFPYPVQPEMSYREFTASFLPSGPGTDQEKLERLAQHDAAVLERFYYTGLWSDAKIGLSAGSPAAILQHLLEQKWKLRPEDRDLVVMHHKIVAIKEGASKTVFSDLYIKGEDAQHTAMAKTVGLPLALGVCLIAEGAIKKAGLHIPVKPEWYNPILEKLESEFQIRFRERELETVA